MSDGIVILVCGGRGFFNRDLVNRTLDRIHHERNIRLLIHGDANGADMLGNEWASSQDDVARKPFPANWLKHGRAAGPIRNRQMLEEGKPDLVVAFPGNRGTADMVKQAKAAGVEVLEVPSE